MTLDWTDFDAKRQANNRPTLPACERETLEAAAREILQPNLADKRGSWGRVIGYGMRSRALVTPLRHVKLGWRRHQRNGAAPLLKFYLGEGIRSGATFIHFHNDLFARLPALAGNPRVQQSWSAGHWRRRIPYAILQYVPGQELGRLLLDDTARGLDWSTNILRQVLLELWAPIWESGLRFKDAHPNNYVVGPDSQVVMIDTEQMRKDATELLGSPRSTEQRSRHEADALKRLPGLVKRIYAGSGMNFRGLEGVIEESFPASAWTPALCSRPNQDWAALKSRLERAIETVHSRLDRKMNHQCGPGSQPGHRSRNSPS